MKQSFWTRFSRRSTSSSHPTRSARRPVLFRPQLETLEELVLLSQMHFLPTYTLLPRHGAVGPQGSATPPTTALNPGQVRAAYGFNQIGFLESGGSPNTTTYNANAGAGQTIAIVDAFDAPNIASDLAVFDQQYGLPGLNLPGGPTFTKVGIDVNGNASTTSFPKLDPGWAGEIELDVEWAHAIAPQANILLVEAANADNTLLNAVDYARNQAGVVAVSMSWGGSEAPGLNNYDTYFTTPTGHIGGSKLAGGVTFFASSGDGGAGVIWPSASANVVAVGGTALSTDSAGDYLGESGWSGSGGGLSHFVSQPSYQKGLVIHDGTSTTPSSGQRAAPDISFVADPSTGVAVYGTDSSFSGWAQVGGTSAGAPQWAALMSLVDQGRAKSGLGSLDGATQTLPDLYQLPSADFHDVTTGFNGLYSAGPGYDLVTGLGTPFANLVVRDLGNSTGGGGGGGGGVGGGGGGGSTQPPTVTSPAQVTTTSHTSPTATLQVAATDPAGASSLTYTWTATWTGAGSAPVTFATTNGTNAASTIQATFRQAGTYTFTVTVTDPAHLSALSSTTPWLVSQQLTTIVVSPTSATVAPGGTQQFTASAKDQFNLALLPQPSSFTWSLSPASQTQGSISSTGLFTANSSASGAVTVQAASGAVQGTATVTVGRGVAVATAAHIVAQTPTTASLSVLGADPNGESNLLYTWSLASGAPASVHVNTNGNNAAKNLLATFSKAGTYNFTVTITDRFTRQTATSQVSVVVGQVLSSLVLSPASAVVAPGATQQFTASGQDQFNNAMALSAPSLTWSVNSASQGSIGTTGLFTAASSGNVTISARATNANNVVITGSANITIAASSSVGFQDDFTHGLSNWTVTSGFGDYFLVNYLGSNRLAVWDDGSNVSRIVAGQASWTNYSYQGTFTVYELGGSASLLARVQDNNHLYFFGYSARLGEWFIALRNGSSTTILAQSAPFGLQTGQDYTVTANLNGSTLQLYVNGVLQVQATDSTFTSGKIGFSSTAAFASLGNVVVTPNGNPQATTAAHTGTSQTATSAGTPDAGHAAWWSYVYSGLFSFFGGSNSRHWESGFGSYWQ